MERLVRHFKIVKVGISDELVDFFWIISAEWWDRGELNARPHAYQACALTT
jgi:hypothetical protein